MAARLLQAAIPPRLLPELSGEHGGKRIKGQKQSANGTLKRGSNSRAYIIARLRRDARADLAGQVEMRTLSARAAVLAAGFRPDPIPYK
jgi:hypothetical protein